MRVRARARVGARVGGEGWAVTVAVSAAVAIAVAATVTVPIAATVAVTVAATVTVTVASPIATTAAALVARLRPVLLGSDAGVLQLGTQPIGGFEVALALGCHPLIQLLLQFPRDRRKAAATATIATTIAAAVPTLVARDDDPGGDLAAEVLPLVVLFGCRLSVLSLVVREESKALVLAVDVGQLEVLEVSELAKVVTQIVLASVKRKSADEQLAALLVGQRRGVHACADDVGCATWGAPPRTSALVGYHPIGHTPETARPTLAAAYQGPLRWTSHLSVWRRADAK